MLSYFFIFDTSITVIIFIDFILMARYFFLKRRFLIVSVVVIVLIVINVICIFKTLNDPVKAIERKWGVSLPAHLSLIYQKNDIGWFGEGQRYSLFLVNKYNEGLVASLGNASQSVKKATEDIITQMKIPYEHIPEWEEDYKCKIIGQIAGTHMCILYFPHAKSLIICEEIC